MIARHSSHLALWILLIGLALPPMAIAADPAPAKKSPASAAEAAKPKEPPAPQAKAIDNDYELYKLLVDTIDQVERNYVTKVDRRELIEAAVRGVIAQARSLFRLHRSGGIGPLPQQRRKRVRRHRHPGHDRRGASCRIISPMCGTPAYRAGLLAGDRIVEIDGKSTDGLTLDEAVGEAQGRRGNTGHADRVHAGKQNREKISIVRERIHIETVLGDHARPTAHGTSCSTRSKHIGYVRLTAFSRDTAAAVAARSLTQLQRREAARADPRPALRSGRAAQRGRRRVRPVHFRGPDRQHQGPQQPRTHVGMPTRTAPSKVFPWWCWSIAIAPAPARSSPPACKTTSVRSSSASAPGARAACRT